MSPMKWKKVSRHYETIKFKQYMAARGAKRASHRGVAGALTGFEGDRPSQGCARGAHRVSKGPAITGVRQGRSLISL